MNYIKQTDTYSCGPIAVMNARIFQGHTPQFTLEQYSKMMNCTPPDGTKIIDFCESMYDFGFTRVYTPTIEKLNAILDGGDAVIINHGDKRRHYSLIIGRSATKYDIVNHYCGATITPIKVAKFISDVWRDPKTWVVRA